MTQTVTRPVFGGATGNSFSSTTTTTTGSGVRYVDKALEALDPKMTPFLDLIGMNGAEIDSPKAEWGDLREDPVSDQLNGAITAGATTLVVDNVARFQQYQMIQIESEVMLVTGITDGTSTLTVTRGWGGTTAAAHADNLAVEITGVAVPENMDTPPSPVTRGELYYNYPQIFNYGIQVSYMQDVSAEYLRRTPEYKAELRKKMGTFKRHLERTCFLGRRAAATGALPYSMGGFPQFITQHVTTLTGAPLTEDILLDEWQETFDDVGPENMGYDVLMKSFAKRVLSSWFSSARDLGAGAKRATDVINSYETDLGVFNFHLLHWNPADALYTIKPSNLKVHPYRGGRLQDEPLAKSGPYHKGMVYGEYTGIFKGDRAHSKITGFSTDKNQYPTLFRA